MAEKTFQSVADCQEALAKYVDEKYFILCNYFKEKKLKQFEDAAKAARESFASAHGSAASAVRATKELDALESQFVKWYEADEELDDAPLFTSIVSFIRDTKARLAAHKSAMEGLAAGRKGKCMEMLGESFENYKSAAQKACSLAQGGDERTADTASTILRYIDLNHEMRVTEMMAPSGKSDALSIAIARTGSEHMQLSNMRAHAYHAENAALQKAAAELLMAFYGYQGALCASYYFAEKESG